MNILTRRTLLYYADKYPLASESLKSWYEEFAKSVYRNFNDLKSVYGNASIIGNNRVVFNIRGNCFRLITSLNFETQALYIIWFGSHAEYDKVDAAMVKHIRNPFKQK
jgi:mRNA interferase HigB